MDLSNKNELISYLQREGLYTKKALGQNFLVDKDSLENIVKAAEIKPDDLIVEVGPGLGVLTEELVKCAGEVIAVELDKSLAELLNCYIAKLLEEGKSKKFKVINADILKLDLDEIIRGRKYKVVANIPYYITSKIIRLFLTAKNKPEIIVLLVQKEVAERICASPGQMSVLSVSVQAYGKPEIVGIVKKESFFPSPKVDSAILKIAISDKLLAISNEREFFRLVHIGFASRRKTLLNNLSNGYRLDRKIVSDILEKAGLLENARAQELSVEQWSELTGRITNHE